ncbi:MAG: hypothetical protein M3M99_00905, partial [Actinomycetota bacterium]|nr:hypothetical protein [Actinomycetota bacterium]
MRPGGGTARASVGVAVAAAAVLAALLLPGAAAARKPVISHLDGNQLSLYDAETGKDSAPLPVAIADPNTFRYGISKNGRFVFFNDANKKLHLLDRNGNREVPLPGIDIYANPGFLTVSNFGLLAFDDNANGPAVVYDSNSKQFVPTGFAANSGHRQTQLSGTGEFLATTCMQAGNCVVDPPSGVAPFVQSLASRTNAPVADDPNRDEE